MLAIYQPGHVGSSSIYEAITQKNPSVIHCHGWRSRGLSSSFETNKLFDTIECKLDDVKMIVPVRDPVDWNISRFFFRFKKYTGMHLEDADQSPENLVSLFVDSFDPNELPNWYNENIVDKLGIPLYDTPFPSEGYIILEKDHLKLLVMRLELDDETKSNVIGSFLDTELQIAHTNRSDSRFYADSYNAFKANGLPEGIVNQIYESEYAKHFYAK